MRIAIFGGAFNPVHREHVRLAQAAVEELELDKIIIMPSAISPHKSGRPCADFWERYEMCLAAFSCLPQAEVSNYELTRGGVSYTCLTSSYFRGLYPNDKLFFIIGADMLKSFSGWKNPNEILKNLTLAACAREDSQLFCKYKTDVENQFGVKVETISYVGDRVSSTRIRTLAALGEDFSGYVNENVCQYIKDRKLYLIENLQKVKRLVGEKRWRHTVGVALLCACNAEYAGLSETDAITMAALHDVAKYLPADSEYFKGFTCPENVPPPVVHQYAGAYVAKNFFGVENGVILGAIGCHCSGKPNMNRAEKLLLMCDVLEESRNFAGIEELRKLFETDRERCLEEILRRQIEYVKAGGQPLYPLTEQAYKFLKEEKNDE